LFSETRVCIEALRVSSSRSERIRKRMPLTEQGPAIADRTPSFASLSAKTVPQGGNTMIVTAEPRFVLEITGSAAKTGLGNAALVLGAVLPAVVGGPLVRQMDAGRGL
jgi:hypothetical protein